MCVRHARLTNDNALTAPRATFPSDFEYPLVHDALVLLFYYVVFFAAFVATLPRGYDVKKKRKMREIRMQLPPMDGPFTPANHGIPKFTMVQH
jgi:hypothetical protein